VRPLRVASVALLAAAACGSTHHDAGCNAADPNACPGGAVCEPVSGGAPACFPPVVVSGQVTDLATGSPIPGARVVAMDPNRAPASTVATADANGNYVVAVPSTRAPDGTPISSITLRADAQAYQSFPSGLRTALPIDLSTATNPSGSRWNVQGPLTAVKLIHLADTTNLTSIQGIVAKPPSRVGVLVVATPQAGGPARTAIADVGGAYTVFNLPAAAAPGASYTVNAYAQGANYLPAPVALVLGTTPPQVNLFVHDTSTAGFTGNLIFNSGASAPTSVTLVVQSTYDAALDRGESPPGLVAQVPPGGSTYAFTGVPDGTYTALAAFGIDGDVRDESGVGNTAPVQLTVQGGALQGAPAQFKLVGAVALTSIDGVAVGSGGVPVSIASATPAFVWAKAPSYSSAATFDSEVLDAFGTSLWTTSQPGSGAGPFTSTYAGPALQSGMYYQLRVTARDGVGNPLSRTEDLRGVFFKP
jgi:hypothetical protein